MRRIRFVKTAVPEIRSFTGRGTDAGSMEPDFRCPECKRDIAREWECCPYCKTEFAWGEVELPDLSKVGDLF